MERALRYVPFFGCIDFFTARIVHEEEGKRLVESKGVKWRVNRSRRPSESYHFADEEDRFAGRPARSQARAKL